MSEHISDLRWDQLLAGDLAPDQADAARAHAKSCTTCSARFAELEAGAKAFDVPMPVVRRARWPLAAAIAAVALAAGVFLVIRPHGEPSDTRTKGHGAQLSLLGGPALAPLASGDPIKPGDRLQAVYSANRDGFGAVLSIDRTNTPSSYVPSSGTSMVALPAGTQQSYPESTIADATLGQELVVVVWCEQPHPLQPLLEQLRTRHVTAPPGCTTLEVTIEK